MIGLKSGLRNGVKLRPVLVIYQTVRCLRPRKPFWLGIAKSKMFVFPKERKLPHDENIEIQKLTSIYRNQMKSMLNFIRVENIQYQKKLKENELALHGISQLDSEIKKSFETNEMWNAESAKLRDARVKNELEEKKLEALKKMDEMDAKQRELQKRVEEIVRKEKEKSREYVTPENLDEAIENCLNNVVDYNFAIDLQGNRYHGKDPFIPSKTEANKIEKTAL